MSTFNFVNENSINRSPIVTESTTTSECVDKYIGDTHCDDENNNEICDWDGGDSQK